MNSESYFINNNDILGRKGFLSKLVKIIEAETKVINIYGNLGIGKSTICYGLINTLDRKNYLSYVVNGRGCFSFDTLLSRFLDIFNLSYTGFSLNTLIYEIKIIANTFKVVFYIDNFEDCICDKKVFSFINELSNINNVQILLSSRCIVEGSYNLELKSLTPSICMKLFKNTASQNGGIIIKDNIKLKEFICDQLDKHTLSIKLVASKAYLYKDEIELIDSWKEDKKQFLKGEGELAGSLNLSVYSSYRHIMNDELSVFIWCCFAFFPHEITNNIFKIMFSDNYLMAKKSIEILIKHHLIEQTENGYYMLQPIRDTIFDFIDVQKIKFYEKDPAERILEYYLNECDNFEESFSIICYALIFLLRRGMYQNYKSYVIELLIKCRKIYIKYAYIALPLVDAVKEYILPNDSSFSKSKTYLYLADLNHIVGNNDLAIKYYDISKKELDDSEQVELIKILRKQCEIFRLYSNREDALKVIEEAYALALSLSDFNEMLGVVWQKSEIFRLIDKDYNKALDVLLELSNDKSFESFPKLCDVLWSIGEIYRAKNKKKLSRKYIQNAIYGFAKYDNVLGLGYAYLSLAKLNADLKNSNSLSLCDKSLMLFHNAGYDLGEAHCFLWKATFFSKTNIKESFINLNNAFSKYSRVGYLQGITDVEKTKKYMLQKQKKLE